MSDIALVAILLAAFALAIGLVTALGRLIESDAPDGWAEEEAALAPPSLSESSLSSVA